MDRVRHTQIEGMKTQFNVAIAKAAAAKRAKDEADAKVDPCSTSNTFSLWREGGGMRIGSVRILSSAHYITSSPLTRVGPWTLSVSWS